MAKRLDPHSSSSDGLNFILKGFLSDLIPLACYSPTSRLLALVVTLLVAMTYALNCSQASVSEAETISITLNWKFQFQMSVN